MIQASDLRIGNIVQVEGIVVAVRGADLHLAEDQCMPVPADPVAITEEHLKVLSKALPGYKLPNHIQYFHQLQNYFHAITGKELLDVNDLPGFSCN